LFILSNSRPLRISSILFMFFIYIFKIISILIHLWSLIFSVYLFSLTAQRFFYRCHSFILVFYHLLWSLVSFPFLPLICYLLFSFHV
jgi:hypothetical protein